MLRHPLHYSIFHVCFGFFSFAKPPDCWVLSELGAEAWALSLLVAEWLMTRSFTVVSKLNFVAHTTLWIWRSWNCSKNQKGTKFTFLKLPMVFTFDFLFCCPHCYMQPCSWCMTTTKTETCFLATYLLAKQESSFKLDARLLQAWRFF